MNSKNNKPGFLIGWARGDITPPRPVLLDGQFHARVSERVNDPLTVTALALEGAAGDGTPAQAIIVSCDMVGVDFETVALIREALAPQTPGFDVARLIVGATHTHTAMVLRQDKYPLPAQPIMTPDECKSFFVERVAATAAEAWQKRAAGGISSAYAYAVVGRNRRAVFADGSARMYANTNMPDFLSLEGYEDHGVDLLFTWDMSRNLTGVLVNIACPSQETEGERYVSADFWHEARIAIRERLGKDVPILAQCAPAGDQSPHLLVMKSVESYMNRLRGLTARQEFGRRIAAAVADGAGPAATDICYAAPFAHHVERLALPRRMVTDAEYAQAQAELEALSRDTALEPTARHSFMRRNREVIARWERQKTEPCLPIELHVLRLGSLAMATNPFELFLDYGIRIKARSPAFQNFLSQITCGYMGYLPTEKAVAAAPNAQERAKPGFSGNYGAGVASNQVGPEGGRLLVERTLEVMRNLFK